jgi:hypothetical protein
MGNMEKWLGLPPGQSSSRAEPTPEDRSAANTDVLRRGEWGRAIGTLIGFVLIYYLVTFFFH